MGALLVAIGCSAGNDGKVGMADATKTGGGGAGPSAPSQATDTNASNPHVTKTPPSTPNGSGVTSSPGASGGAGTTGAAGETGTGGAAGAAGTVGSTGAGGVAGTTGAAGAGGAGGMVRNWPTVDCVGGPCAAPNVCVNLDFLFVACVPCGGNDEVCCPPFAADDPFLGTCDAGLICASNPNFQSVPPTDVVRNVCQIPGMPPPADGGLNHERVRLFP